ncbi:MAG: flagellar hook-length control protein FliK [Planctomycetota bacterium]
MATTIDPLLQLTPAPAPTIDRGAETGASFADELQRAQSPEEPPAAGPAKETKPERGDEPDDAEAERADETTAAETSGGSGGDDEAAAVVESDADNGGAPAETEEESEGPSEQQPEDTVELSEQAAAALGLVAEGTTPVQPTTASEVTTVARTTAEAAAGDPTSSESAGALSPSETAGTKAAANEPGTTEAATGLPADAAPEQSAGGGNQGDPEQPQQFKTTSNAAADGDPNEDSAAAQGDRAQQSGEPSRQQQSLGGVQESGSPALAASERATEGEATDRGPQPAASVPQSLDTPAPVPGEAAAAVAEAAAPETSTDAGPKQNDAAGPPTIQRLFGERGVAAQQPAEEPAGVAVDRGRFVSRVANAFRVAQQRDGEIQLRLSPPQLGSLKITLTVQDGALAANLEAESPAARGVLLDNLPALRERLAEQEIRVEKFDVNVRDEGGGQRGDAPEGDHRNRERSRRGDQAAGVETGADAIATEEPAVGGDGALDVRI